MKFRVFHKELNKYLDLGEWTDNTSILDILLSIDLSFVIAVGMPNEKFEIGKDVEIEWGFEYKGKEYFENDIVKALNQSGEYKCAVLKWSNFMRSFNLEFSNGKTTTAMYIYPTTDIIGNYRLNPELMEGV